MSVANQIEEESNDLNKAVTVGAQYYIFESCNFVMLLQYFMKMYLVCGLFQETLE